MKVSDTISCTKRLTFCAGHRVMGDACKCQDIHGHNYVVYVTAEAPSLGVVFRCIGQRLGQWLGEKWDHGFIVFVDDEVMMTLLNGGPLVTHKHFVLPTNPTAENLAAYLLREVCPTLFADTQITITRIQVHETEDCYADATIG